MDLLGPPYMQHVAEPNFETPAQEVTITCLDRALLLLT